MGTFKQDQDVVWDNYHHWSMGQIKLHPHLVRIDSTYINTLTVREEGIYNPYSTIELMSKMFCAITPYNIGSAHIKSVDYNRKHTDLYEIELEVRLYLPEGFSEHYQLIKYLDVICDNTDLFVFVNRGTPRVTEIDFTEHEIVMFGVDFLRWYDRQTAIGYLPQ